MGAIISKFRKDPLTLEQQLEALEKQIFQIHEFNEATEHAMKKIVGAMLFYGIMLIIIGGVAAYFIFDHSSFASSLICFAPVFFAPVVLLELLLCLSLIGSKRLLQYHYTSRIERKKEELNRLIKLKKVLINKVKETETYKKAQEILEKYDPDTRMRKAQAEQQRAMAAVLQQSGMDIRRRMVGTPMNAVNMQNVSMLQGHPQQQPQQQQQQQLQQPFTPLKHGQLRKTIQPMPSQVLTANRSPYAPRTVRPILPQERGAVEKVIDYIVGEGPNNRYALICKKCCSHNGMALREEFEFLAFQCCYCFHFNPARKQRPGPPPSLNHLSAANSTTSLNDISRSGSPVPSGPSTKDSDQDGETEAENAASFTSATDVPQVGAEGDAPTGARPAPEGDENEPTITDDSQQERIIQQEPQLATDDPPEST
ncbi:protein lunapark-B-like isoform X1 [Varroa jacobsoni]|uniref:Endoplasmic reticulum junction formation protein lunapark n=1 Tax=Varroa destructor TaxID=109461 RepID=A0A7M7JC67_VARDE|nr:protein lunapark-B-like isoform X3 [Varroa destructor]XP_022690749.1 protein lunapark-B-like isoform X1 [Varroa jacobsoni]